MIRLSVVSLAIAVALTACGGRADGFEVDPVTVDSVDAAPPCDKQAAVDAYRAKRGQLGEVGEWSISIDCRVCNIHTGTPEDCEARP